MRLSMVQVTAVVLIAMSGWALKHRGDYSALVPAGGLNFVIATGFVISAIAALGSYGALLRSRRLLWWFSVLATAQGGVY